MQALDSLPKHKGVAFDIDAFIMEVTLHDKETISLRAYSSINPRVTIGLPKAIQKYQGKTMYVTWMNWFVEMVGAQAKGSRKQRRGFKGSPYIKIF